MSRMGDAGLTASLKEIRSLIKEVANNVVDIKAKLDTLDPNSQNDFAPDEGDHRWPGLDNIKKASMYPWHSDNTTTTDDVLEGDD
mgnify:CR=1 FL=1